MGDADVQRAAAAMVGRFRAQAQQLVHGLLPRVHDDLRVAQYGTDDHFLIVARSTGPEAALHLRPRNPLRGEMIDAATGATVATLQFTGPAEALWDVPVPEGQRGLMLLVFRRDEPTR